MKLPRRCIRVASGLGLLVPLVGCAFGNRSTGLAYPPQEGTSLGASPAQAAPVPTESRISIVVIPFSDGRDDKQHIGQVRNALGMRTAWVLSSTDVSTWINDAVVLELENAGYQVKRAGAASDSGAVPVLSGEVLKVFGDAYMTYGGDVTLAVRVTSAGKEIHRKTYTSHQTAGTNWTASGGGYANALAAALSDDLHQLVADLKGLNPGP